MSRLFFAEPLNYPNDLTQRNTINPAIPKYHRTALQARLGNTDNFTTIACKTDNSNINYL